MLGTGVNQRKAATLPDTVRGRAEHGGQGMGKHFVVTLALRLVIEDIIGAAPGRGAQRFRNKSGVALISAFTEIGITIFLAHRSPIILILALIPI